MRAACVFISHFPIAVELLARPACTGGPVVIGGTPEQRKAVLGCSPEVEAQGVRPGRPLRQALGLGDVKLAGSAGLALGGPSHPSRPPDHHRGRRLGGGRPGPAPQTARLPHTLRALHLRRRARRASVAGQRLCQPLAARKRDKADDRGRKRDLLPARVTRRHPFFGLSP